MPTHTSGYRRIPSQDSIMSQVSNWDTYRARGANAPSTAAPPAPSRIPAPTTVAHPSTMAVPTSTVPHTYIQPPGRNKNKAPEERRGKRRRGLFSFGVRRRGSRRALRPQSHPQRPSQGRPRFRTPAELDAVLALADIQTLPAHGALPLPRVATYAAPGLGARGAGVVAAGTVPRAQYTQRKPSVRGTRPAAFTPITQTQARLLQLRRSSTAPTRRHRERHGERSRAARQEQRLRSLWQQYLRLVIHQRIRLRLALMDPERGQPAAPNATRNKHVHGSRDNPIVIPDGPDTASSAASASVSADTSAAVTRRRKAY